MLLKQIRKKEKLKYIFRHQSPYSLKTLEPLSYDKLIEIRSEEMTKDEVRDYIVSRIKTEIKYRKLLNHPFNKTFLYATIVGFHKMKKPDDYPGFTYYFSLTDDEIENCLFQVVAKDSTTEPIKGMVGLKNAITFWKEHKEELKSETDSVLGSIDPRIEVIIPFAIKPFAFYPQEEDR